MKLYTRPELHQYMLRVLRSLCGSWGVLPASYTLQGDVKVIDEVAWTCAGFSEVWRGTWGSEKVAIKVIKITGAADPGKLKKVCVVAHP